MVIKDTVFCHKVRTFCVMKTTVFPEKTEAVFLWCYLQFPKREHSSSLNCIFGRELLYLIEKRVILAIFLSFEHWLW